MLPILFDAPRKKRSRTYDLFTYALGIGAVNGTACAPGPGTRTVVDTDGKLYVGDEVWFDDFFDIERAAGAVNGTELDSTLPNLYIRTVVDTDGKLTIGA